MRAVLSPFLASLLLATAAAAPSPRPALPVPLGPSLAAVQATTLTPAERAHLLRAREEQKLARDLYIAFGDLYPDVVAFDLMQRDEGLHMGRVFDLLTTYEVPDPVGARGPGLFASDEMQRLYTTSLAEGRASKAAALRVGARIEELDIADLTRGLRESTTPDLVRLFEMLARGSRRHLRTFVQALEAETGTPYAPQVLPRDAYDAIMQGEPARGRPASSR